MYGRHLRSTWHRPRPRFVRPARLRPEFVLLKKAYVLKRRVNSQLPTDLKQVAIAIGELSEITGLTRCGVATTSGAPIRAANSIRRRASSSMIRYSGPMASPQPRSAIIHGTVKPWSPSADSISLTSPPARCTHKCH